MGGQIPFPGTSDDYTVEQVVNIRMTEEGPAEEPMYIVRQKGMELFRVTPHCDYNWDTEKLACTHQIQELDFYTEGVLHLVELSGLYAGRVREGVPRVSIVVYIHQ